MLYDSPLAIQQKNLDQKSFEISGHGKYHRGLSGGNECFRVPLRLLSISPPILLCETSNGSESDWIKTTKKVTMTNDWTSMGGRGHLTKRKHQF